MAEPVAPRSTERPFLKHLKRPSAAEIRKTAQGAMRTLSLVSGTNEDEDLPAKITIVEPLDYEKELLICRDQIKQVSLDTQLLKLLFFPQNDISVSIVALRSSSRVNP